MPLTPSAALGAQERELFEIFDPFRHNVKIKRLAEMEHRYHNRPRVRRAAGSCDERAIDFQHTDVELQQVRKGGIPRTEVVYGDLHTMLLEKHKVAIRRVRGLHQSTLRYLKD
jgi:hypothetical protein